MRLLGWRGCWWGGRRRAWEGGWMGCLAVGVLVGGLVCERLEAVVWLFIGESGGGVRGGVVS